MRRITLFIFSLLLIVAIGLLSVFNRPVSATSGQSALPPVIKSRSVLFRVVGHQILLPSGQQYIPEGISIFGGLEDTDYGENLANIDAQIEAAAMYWHTNTIRLQVAESNLFSHDSLNKPYNQQFLNQIIKQVRLARSLNQAVVINDQTEFTTNTLAPTSTTVKFWHVMASTFSNQPFVIFDLFNEPRLYGTSIERHNNPKYHLARILLSVNTLGYMHHHKHHNYTKNTSLWQVWKYGGTIGGVKYVGMQTLVNKIRSWGVNNLIWIEGPYWAQRLPVKPYLISGSNIVYSYHHIDLNQKSDWSFIAKLAKTHAVVDGEWAQYQSPWAECYSRAPITTPQYLSFLHDHDIGLIAWSLQKGSLLKGNPSIEPSNLNSPSNTTSADQLRVPSEFSYHYLCNSHFGQGAGALIKQFFKANSTLIY